MFLGTTFHSVHCSGLFSVAFFLSSTIDTVWYIVTNALELPNVFHEHNALRIAQSFSGDEQLTKIKNSYRVIMPSLLPRSR